MVNIKIVYVFAGYDIDLLVPFGIQGAEHCQLFGLPGCQGWEVSEYFVHVSEYECVRLDYCRRV